MKFDLKVLTLILGLAFTTEFIALALQYKINRIYRGIGWWLAGAGLMTLAFFLMPLMVVPPVAFLAKLAQPSLVLGQICLYVGILRFLGKKERPRAIAAFYAAFLLCYYYFIYFHYDISGRTEVVSGTMAIVMALTAWPLLARRGKAFLGSARFTAAALGGHALFLAVQCAATLTGPALRNYTDLRPITIVAFLIPIVTSMLWTFGFILMVNQRLNEEIIAEKETLRESEETYRSILEASPDDITITDLEGRIFMASPAAYRMFGYPKGAEKGMRLLDFVLPEDHARARANLGLMPRKDSPRANEYRGVRRDGTVFDIEVNSALINGLDGRPAKWVFIVRDISARRRAEAEQADLAARNRQLQKAESLGRMAGAIAHHFNNQLQAVLGNLELATAVPGDPELGQRLARAREAAERAAQVSGLMLVYLGQSPGKQEALDLGALCRVALPGLLRSLPETVAFSADLPASGPMINGTARQIGEVLASLVTNAWEALGGAIGSVQLSLDTCPGPAIPAGHRFPIAWEPQAPAYACLQVADTGCGIPEADLEKVFDPFFSTRFPGRGLGLSVVLGIVQAHGGAVGVTSRPGQGCVFRIYLPLG
jgi:PAS domain S-box-containing protein